MTNINDTRVQIPAAATAAIIKKGQEIGDEIFDFAMEIVDREIPVDWENDDQMANAVSTVMLMIKAIIDTRL